MSVPLPFFTDSCGCAVCTNSAETDASGVQTTLAYPMLLEIAGGWQEWSEFSSWPKIKVKRQKRSTK
jgi:hypothetical protein